VYEVMFGGQHPPLDTRLLNVGTSTGEQLRHVQLLSEMRCQPFLGYATN
jgi:hypothetical protein